MVYQAFSVKICCNYAPCVRGLAAMGMVILCKSAVERRRAAGEDKFHWNLFMFEQQLRRSSFFWRYFYIQDVVRDEFIIIQDCNILLLFLEFLHYEFWFVPTE